ncbi:MAG TPA: dihydropteroate synthase [Saprospiraceae bacterium]|nr:dihydropteroate synthase [Saprospiraceae bacterium]
MKTLNCNGKLLVFDQAKLMGILNLTPDSFFDGGRIRSVENALSQVENMIHHGAEIIDIGAMSSRPGAAIITAKEEIERLKPYLNPIARQFPELVLSIDTIHSETATFSINEGADMINDISAGDFDPLMIDTVAKLKVPFAIMHMNGTPETMQKTVNEQSDVLNVLKYLIDKKRKCEEVGILDIIIDPGFGFGKSVNQNYSLLKQLTCFEILEKPILVGLSRKSMICKPLHLSPEDALNGTTALNMVALQNGADILRVHDVKEANQVRKLYGQLKEA